MAVWFIDGFDHYTTAYPFQVPPMTANSNLDILRKWTTISSAVISPGYARQQPGQGVLAQNSQMGQKTRPGAVTDTYIVGFAFLITTTNQAVTNLVTFYDTTEQVSVRTDGLGHITFTRNGTVLATSTNTYSANTWYYLEVKSKIHNTTGTYEVRINGSSTGWIAPATGQNTRATSNNQLTGFGIGASGASLIYFDDLYAADTTGSANTDFLGPQMVVALRPSGAGNYAQWTPNFGANFGNVNEIFPDGDASFNQSSTANNIDSFVMQDAPIQSGTITAIQHVIYAKQDAGAQRQIAPFQRESSTDYVGTTVNLATSYTYYLEVKDVDPATSAAYTLANLNAAEFGYKLIS